MLAFRIHAAGRNLVAFFINPLLVALLARPLLGEKLRMRTWFVIMAGFSGALLIARPGGTGRRRCSLYGVCRVLLRRLSGSDAPAFADRAGDAATVLHGADRHDCNVACAGHVSSGDDADARCSRCWLSLWGCWLALAIFFFIRAFRDSPASSLSPMLYFQIVWVTLLGWLVFDQYPDGLSTLGMLVIAASGLALIMGSAAPSECICRCEMRRCACDVESGTYLKARTMQC